MESDLVFNREWSRIYANNRSEPAGGVSTDSATGEGSDVMTRKNWFTLLFLDFIRVHWRPFAVQIFS